MSSTADKTLELLNMFTISRPQIGLSEMARLAGLDKATAHRLLVVLAKHGLLEQDSVSRHYRLGAGTLRLARNREASFPAAIVIEPFLHKLVEQTGETSHASLVAGSGLATVGMVPGRGALHVTLDPGERLPFHATASGYAYLAYVQDDEAQVILNRKLKKFTEHTDIEPQSVLEKVRLARSRGYAATEQTYESDVTGIAAPLFGANRIAIGSIAVATPSHRMTAEIMKRTTGIVMSTALSVTRRLGGDPSPAFTALVKKALQ